MQQFTLTIAAGGEVRDSHGRLVDQPAGTQTVTVSAAELGARFTDTELAAAGLSDTDIEQIRSATA